MGAEKVSLWASVHVNVPGSSGEHSMEIKRQEGNTLYHTLLLRLSSSGYSSLAVCERPVWCEWLRLRGLPSRPSHRPSQLLLHINDRPRTLEQAVVEASVLKELPPTSGVNPLEMLHNEPEV